jgi:hypothetical protein
MLSNKNKHKSFIYEEEYDHTNRPKETRQDTLTDSLEQKGKDIILRVSGEDIKIEKENQSLIYSYLREFKFQTEAKVRAFIILAKYLYNPKMDRKAKP